MIAHLSPCYKHVCLHSLRIEIGLIDSAVIINNVNLVDTAK